MPLYHESLSAWTSVQDTFCSFFAHFPNCFWIDREHHPTERYSVIGVGLPTGDPKMLLDETDLELPFSFRPNLIGVIHYPDQIGEIQGFDLLSVDRAFVFDHDRKKLHFLGRFENRSDFDAWHHAALLRLALIGGDSSAHQLNKPAATASSLKPLDSREQYLGKIETAKSAIARGDVYQLCLTTKLVGGYSGDELSYFLRLRKQSPAPYASFIRVADKSYVSISPERFIAVSGSRVSTSPIKGTRPRGATEQEDQELRAELSQSQKEQAENLMIVDLVRNDLSVVAKPETVTVTGLLQVQSFSTVHQLVSDVSGELAESKTGIDALGALIPGGSMTGAPKRRAMELLAEMESSPRQGYSGGIGWIGFSGDMDLAMVIRTAIFEAGVVTIGIGGGITSDSDPVSEHEEIQIKARALTKALSATVDW